MMGFGGMMNGYGMMGPNGMMGRYGYGYSPLGGILSLVFFGLLIAGAVLLILWLVRNAGAGALNLRHPGEMPLDIIKTRYAKGEITKEQYDALRRDLQG
jgi:putative membrane protein